MSHVLLGHNLHWKVTPNSGDSRIKKRGATAGPGKKQGPTCMYIVHGDFPLFWRLLLLWLTLPHLA